MVVAVIFVKDVCLRIRDVDEGGAFGLIETKHVVAVLLIWS